MEPPFWEPRFQCVFLGLVAIAGGRRDVAVTARQTAAGERLSSATERAYNADIDGDTRSCLSRRTAYFRLESSGRIRGRLWPRSLMSRKTQPIQFHSLQFF